MGNPGFSEWHAATRDKAKLPAPRADEVQRPWSKYYFEELPEPDPAQLALADTPCDPSRAIYPEQMNELLNPGALEIETGWCNLPNGAGFVANRIVYPDVTAAMIDWWFAWHPLEDLRYRLWYPPQHAGVMVSPAGRERLLNAAIPLAERNWGVTHHVTEDCNCGMENIDITFLSPQKFGFDMRRWGEPNVATFAGGYGWSVPVARQAHSVTAPSLMCHIFRNTPRGLEHRTRFWMGYRFSGGKPELTLPPGVSVPAPVIRGLLLHNIHEFTRFRTLLPRIYAEFGEQPSNISEVPA
jgi:hypothetical protein